MFLSCNDEFIGEIPLKERVKTIEESKVRLARNLIIKDMQQNTLREHIEAVHYIADMNRMAYFCNF